MNNLEQAHMLLAMAVMGNAVATEISRDLALKPRQFGKFIR